ncbi:murein L,D-transpeptidase YafK [Peteryoungia aggregata LMG 23059]|uniref:Murein L,D-transpeptidase YafK n=1 Tax=Peteryoungia aggregata LMG 23059 TaxID=1368425 RepID=A0ABU0GC91_9HYPH|nr:L,D-transpeptidase family protein [Peteryoungia aggregata]MDQ0422923.1 murein L,D-transpeptidase YafK [Peteryoungia aggregata LMG 23059]
MASAVTRILCLSSLLAASLLLIWLGLVMPSAATTGIASHIVVDKSDRRLDLMQGEAVMATFAIALGGAPEGHKGEEGDQRTPEGHYVIDWRNDRSGYHLSLHISYPDAADIARAEAEGKDHGGMIMIHGQRNALGWLAFLTQRFDWTDGCIAVTNADMDIIWNTVPDGTPIEITP